MRYQRIFFCLIAALAMTGCVPERYAWSPDGKWMTVLGPQGLGICDAQGKMLAASVGDISQASWFSDSRRLLTRREIHITRWNDMTPYLTTQQADAVADCGERACQALLAYDWTAPNADSWDQFQAWFKAQEDQAKYDLRPVADLQSALAVYVRTYANDAQRQKIPAERLKELDGVTGSVFAVQVYTYTETALMPGPILMTSLKGNFRELRVAPSGTAAIVTSEGEGNDELSNLWIIATDEKRPPLLVSDKSSWYPDWDADGHSVDYIARTSADKSGATVGSLARAGVLGADGKVLDKVESSADLAGLIYDQLCRVRCLKDGRILFSGVQITLPAAPVDVPHRPELFAVLPGKQATVSRVVPSGSLDFIGDAAQYFEPSPDGTHVTIPGFNGTITVLDLGSGEVVQVQGEPFPGNNKDDHLTLPSIPSWRNSDELTFMTPDARKVGKVVLWSCSKKSGRILSSAWPTGMIEDKPPAK